MRAFMSASDAKRYFNESLSPGDYFTRGQELAGEWSGRGAARLGLAGRVEKDAFHRLCDNLRPDSGERLTLRTREGRRVAYDIGFSAPKSVSALYETTGDERILEAFRQSIRETLRDHMEPEMQTRVRKGGAFENRTTGEMIWAEFIHRTGRPVEGVPDPQLHCHVFAFNATFDPEEKVWKAGEFGDLKANAPYFEAVQQSIFGNKLVDLGYSIRHKSKGWEVDGVPATVVSAFSRRTKQIEAVAAKLGVSDPDRKGELGARTRAKKAQNLSMEELRSKWEDRLAAADRAALWETYEQSKNGGSRHQRTIDADAALTFALDDLLERASVVNERTVLAGALKHAIGHVDHASLMHALNAAVSGGRILRREIDGKTLVTTPEVIAEERRMLKFARDCRGQCDPLKSREHVFADTALNKQQREAVRHVLSSSDQVTAIRGAAGVGKTRLMRETVNAIEATGRKVFAFAPGTDASRGTLRGDGFKNATTVASLLVDPRMQAKVKDQVIWIDEAGMMGVRDMARVLDVARRQNARVILTGDTRQHRSVARGDAMRLLEEQAGIRPAAVTTIVRQRIEQYREAVEHLATGELADAVDKLDRLSAIREVDNATRHREVAREFVDSVKGGRTAIVVSPTHAEGRRTTETIREALKSEGIVKHDERAVSTLVNLKMTNAAKADPRFYERGLIVQISTTIKGFRPGERMEVLGEHASGKALHVRSTVDGREKLLPLKQAPNYEVYRKEDRMLAVGDRVRFTKNHRSFDNHRIDNGTIRTIREFDKDGRIVLDNGWVIGKEHGHLTPGYVVTSHASQSKTVDHVIIAQGAESFAASDMMQFYVSVSRGVFKVSVYTDEKDALIKAVDRTRERMSGVEFLQQGRELPPPQVQQLQQDTERAARIEAHRQSSESDELTPDPNQSVDSKHEQSRHDRPREGGYER